MSTVRYIQQQHPNLRGFTRPNLFRMRQFFEAYKGDEKVSPLVRQLPWTHHLIILGQAKRPEEREFYLRLATRERWGKRELERQLRVAAFERAVLNPAKVSALVAQTHPTNSLSSPVFANSQSLRPKGSRELSPGMRPQADSLGPQAP